MSGSTGHRDKRIADYVRNRADDETVRQLEIEMLDDDELFEKVQAEALLHKALEQAEKDGQPVPVNSKRGGWIANTGWALAATFAAVAIGLGIHTARLDERLESLQEPTAGLQVITLFEQRSALLGGSDEQKSLQTGSTGALIEIDVSTAEAEHFHLTLQTERRSYAWDAVPMDERGYVTVYVPPDSKVRSIEILLLSGDRFREYQFTQ